MAQDYILNFSDPFKTDNVIVPSSSTGSGKNDYDTSLELVGAGYPAYGQAFAQNFLKLLENFASPYPPENSVEGQLWYDTSDPERKVLRVNNGSDTSSRWPAASGIFQQSNDPALQYSETLKEGDIWVDTHDSQLKIRYGTEWTIVGPQLSSGSDKTGTESVLLESNVNDGNGNPISYPVIKNWVNGKVIEIITYNAFTPRIVIEGFSTLTTGTNITNKFSAKYNGLSEKANALVISGNTLLSAQDIMRNRAAISVHTGTFIVNDSSGFKVKNPNSPGQSLNLVIGNDGNISLNESDTSKSITVKVSDSVFLKLDPNYLSIGVNKAPALGSPALDVNGGAKFTGPITATQLTLTSGDLSVVGKTSLQNNVLISGITTITNRLAVGTSSGSGLIIDPARHDVYDIGTASRRFRHVYAAKFGNTITNSTVFYGNLIGTATKLATSQRFKIIGQITATNNVTFDGSTTATFVTELTKTAITDLTHTASSNANHTLMVLNTSSALNNLESINKQNFLSDVYPYLIPTGMITSYGGSTAPSGYLLCNGALHTSSWYTSLFGLVGYTYGGSGANFKVPDMTTSTFVTTGTSTGTYLTYIIKT